MSSAQQAAGEQEAGVPLPPSASSGTLGGTTRESSKDQYCLFKQMKVRVETGSARGNMGKHSANLSHIIHMCMPES